MPQFTYKAKQGPAKIVHGTIEAESLDGAIGKIVRQGLTPLDVGSVNGESEKQPKSVKRIPFSFSKRVSLNELVQFTRQMSDLVDASVPILRSLQIVAGQIQNPYFKNIIETIYAFVRDGGSFSDALAQYPAIFSPLFINMVKTGEVSGQLEIVLNRLADYMEKEHETRNQVQSSLAYPIFILVFGIITIFVLLTFIIPKLAVMFEDMDQALPLPTRILMNISAIFAQYWWIMAGVVLLGGFYFRQWVGTAQGRLKFDRMKLTVPFFGKFIQMVEVGRFARTLGTLLESGVVITTALKSVWATVQNTVIQEEVKKVAEEVESGSSLKNALKQCFFFPPIAVNMVAVGEETGHLERSLYKVAGTFERQSGETVKMILSLLGPVVLVLIVSLVGCVVIAMLLPIFQMNLLVQ